MNPEKVNATFDAIRDALRASYEAGRASGRYVAGENVDAAPLREASDTATVLMWRSLYALLDAEPKAGLLTRSAEASAPAPYPEG